MTDKPIPITKFRRNTKVLLDGTKVAPIILRRGDELYDLSYRGSVFQDAPVVLEGKEIWKSRATQDEIREKIANEPSAVGVSDLFNTGATEEVTVGNPPQVMNVLTPVRDKGDIMADIREAEAGRDEELRYCQDVEESKKITDKWNKDITALWQEYKEL